MEKENTLKSHKKAFKKLVKGVFKKETITKIIVIVSSLALLATSVLPFILS